MGQADLSHHLFETAAGVCGIAWTAAGVAGFRLPAKDARAAEAMLLRRVPGSRRAAPPATVAAVADGAQRYFAGEAVDFRGVALDLRPQEPFFALVYAFVRGLPWGETTTYGAVARALGAGPEAARDVGRAMAKNPVPLVIPCHRVLAAGGRLGGFSAPGGAAAKRAMLALEGVAPEAAPEQPSFGFMATG